MSRKIDENPWESLRLMRADDLKAEMSCMNSCVDTLSRLGTYYEDKSSPGDSVAEEQAKRAQKRVLEWLVRFIIE